MMKGFRLVQNISVMKGYIWGEKYLKIKGMMGMTVQNWSSRKVCSWFWLSHVVLWEHAGQIPYGRQGRQELLPSYEKVALKAPAGQVEIMLCYWHPLPLAAPAADLALGFTGEHSEDTFAMSQPSPLLFQTLLGPLFVSQCGWYNCSHFFLSQIALWQFIHYLMRKLKILGLIQNMLGSELWWSRVL